MISETCRQCGAVFHYRPSSVPRKFCSLRCCWAFRKGHPRRPHRVLVQCPCGKVVTRYPSQAVAGRAKFCSRRCLGIASVWKNGKVSRPEREFFDALERQGVIVIRQHRVGRYTIDGFVPEWNLAIEVDGAYWHSLPRMVERDRRKTAYLAKRGLRVTRITVRRKGINATRMAAAITAVNRRRDRDGMEWRFTPGEVHILNAGGDDRATTATR